MGKGDKKTRRGKLFQGSFGVRRRKKLTKSVVPAAVPVNKPKAVIETSDFPEPKAVAVVKEAKVARTTKAAPVKKEAKAKKKADTAE